MPLYVRGAAVRDAIAGREARERAAVGHRAGLQVEIQGMDDWRNGVAMVHGAVVRAPCDAVRQAEALIQPVRRQVGVQAIQGPDRIG